MPASRATVDHIVLHDKDGIVDESNVAEGKLDRVARNATPVALKPAVNPLLRDAENAADEIQQDLPDAPSLGALIAPVGDDLGRVLDESYEQLDVTDGVDDVEFAPVRGGIGVGGGDNEEVGSENPDEAAGCHTEYESRRADARIGREAPERTSEVLRAGDYGENEGMEGEGDVVEGYGRGEAVVTGCVLLSNDGRVIKGRGRDKVRSKAFSNY